MSEISVCIITKNEEQNIEKCLSAIRPYPFEIIVVDTGSTDNTRAIAAKYADAVYDFTWINDFSAARNFSISKASNNWILVLDSDEYVTELDYEGLLAFRTAFPNHIGRFTRHSPDRTGSVFVDPVERFFDKNLFHYERMIHEQVVPIHADTLIQYKPIPLTVDHSGYVSMEIAQQKAERNIRMLLEDLKNRPSDVYVLFQIGQAYYMIAEYEKAVEYFEQALSHDVDPQTGYVQLLVTSYAYSLLNLDCHSKAIAFLEQIENEFSFLSDYYYALGLAYSRSQNYIKALPSFVKALSAPVQLAQGTNSFLIFFELGIINAALGNYDSARQFLQKSGVDYPQALKSLEEMERQLAALQN